MRFEPVVGWGALPEGWRYVEAAGVAVDKKDNVLCFTRGEHPVIVFDREGKFLRSWGEGVFRRAHAITIGADGTVWLTDDLHHTVRKFTPEGKLLLTIGDPDKPSTSRAASPSTGRRTSRSARERATSSSRTATATRACTSTTPSGRLLFSWGEPGTDPGKLQHPAQHRHRRRGPRLRRRPREPPGSDLRRRGPVSGASRPTCTARAGCSPTARRRPPLRRRAAGGSADQRRGSQLGARVTVVTLKGARVGRFGGRFAGEKPGEFTAPHGCVIDSRGDLYVAEVS